MNTAKDLSLPEAMREAKDHHPAALAPGAALRVGQDSDPVHHFHRWRSA